MPGRGNSVELKMKLEIIEEIEIAESIGKVNFTAIGKKFNLDRSTVSKISKSRDNLRQQAQSGQLTVKRKRPFKEEDVDEALFLWVKQKLEQDARPRLNLAILKSKATELASELGHEFEPSDGWLNRFKARHGLKFRKRCGDKQAADLTAFEEFQTSIIPWLLEHERKVMDLFHYIGVDVGTGSVRACVVDGRGKILSTHVQDITIWNPRQDYYQQSSDDIWKAVIKTVTTVIEESSIKPASVKGIGFDATCSMVVLDEQFLPLSVSPYGEVEQNIIMWMDHRAGEEASQINATKHKVLDSVGGVMSLEMQPPKLKWLKKNLPTTWENAAHFFDLPDFLTWRASGALSRSLCSLVCKWGFCADGWSLSKMHWDDEFLSLIGLADLKENGYNKLGRQVQPVGSPCGAGLSQKAAKELGLEPGTPVGTSMIDAHAGALACLGCRPTSLSKKLRLPDVDNRLVLIAGTSTCHIICSDKRVSVPGVWGPYFCAMIPDMWVNEGGQSAAGRLIDFVTSSHPAFSAVREKSTERGIHPFEYLNSHLEEMASKGNCKTVAQLTHSIHVWPDYHGNRSPVADPSLRGMVSGLSLSATEDDLALVYLATVQALAYGTRHIVVEMEKHGHAISMVYLCGGLRKNRLYVQTHTDVLGLPLVLPDAEESVLLGAAMLGASASGKFDSLKTVMSTMGGQGALVEPDPSTSSFHGQKFQVFCEMLQDQRKYRDIMKDN